MPSVIAWSRRPTRLGWRGRRLEWAQMSQRRWPMTDARFIFWLFAHLPACNRGKTSGRSGCQAGSADEFREVGEGSVSGDIEPGTEIIPEGDAELGAGFGEAEEGIPAVASGIAAGAAADFAFGDVAADVVFG